jgi:hypothetical protein
LTGANSVRGTVHGPWSNRQQQRRGDALLGRKDRARRGGDLRERFVLPVYRFIEAGLCVLIVVWAIAAAIAISNAPEAARRLESARILEIADENRAFCTRQGLVDGSSAFSRCVYDLNGIRSRHEQRFLEATRGFF